MAELERVTIALRLPKGMIVELMEAADVARVDFDTLANCLLATALVRAGRQGFISEAVKRGGTGEVVERGPSTETRPRTKAGVDKPTKAKPAKAKRGGRA